MGDQDLSQDLETAGAYPGFEKGGFNLVPKRDTGEKFPPQCNSHE